MSTPMSTTVIHTELEGLELIHRGKVRDLYAVGDHLLIVVTDRVSAYDSVLSPGIPGKGQVLTSLSRWWFETLGDLVPNHVITADFDEMPEEVRRHDEVLRGRSMLVRRLDMLPVECVARGYLTGSGWKDYQRTGAVCGHQLPPGVEESARLDPPLFTPATKAVEGHDENIDFERMVEALGGDRERAERLRDLTLSVYGRARDIALERGIIIADTKFEFGLDADGTLVLADEVLTPDSSRFWDAASYQSGRPQQPRDKQLVRNWLDGQGWDHTPPPPPLAPEIVEDLAETYRKIHRQLTGSEVPA